MRHCVLAFLAVIIAVEAFSIKNGNIYRGKLSIAPIHRFQTTCDDPVAPVANILDPFKAVTPLIAALLIIPSEVYAKGGEFGILEGRTAVRIVIE